MLTNEETLQETQKHIDQVRKYLDIIITSLELRIRDHDRSKLSDPELSVFAEYTEKLRDTTYGSPEYKKHLEGMKVALDHHYKNNRHHPEFFRDKQVDGEPWDLVGRMNLVDVVEMLCDWMAATLRHADGDIQKSIQFNKKRFNMSDQLTNILKNTVGLFEEDELLEVGPLEDTAHLIPKVTNVPRIEN